MRVKISLLMTLAAVLLGAVCTMGAGSAGDPDPWPEDVAATGASDLSGLEVLPEASARPQDRGPREPLGYDGPVLRVRVESRDSGRWLPGARVSCWWGPHLDLLRTGVGRDHGEAEHLGRTLVADGQGLVHVPARGVLFLAGRSGEHYGEMTLRYEPEELREAARREHRLLLERDVTLRVRVLDWQGVPAAGVPVEILPAGAASRDASEGAITIRSDAEGIASVAHWQVLVCRRQWSRGLVGRLLVRGRIPGIAEGVIVDPRDPPPEVRLQLPATGRIVVEVFDEAGPLTDYDLTLQVVPRGEETAEVLGTREWKVSVSDGGPARFDPVVLGTRFRALARHDALKAVGVFSGPLDADQEVSVALHATVESSVLVGRAVDSSLEPIAGASLRLVYATEAGAASRLVATDAGGRFRVNLGHAASQRALIEAEISLSSDVTASTASFGLVHRLAPRPLRPGDLDLGDIVLGQAPVLAAGRIVTDGASSQAVDLVVEREQCRAGQASWEQDRLAAVRFPEAGRFEVRGLARSTRYRLRLGSGSHLPFAPVEFTPGAKDLEVRLRTGGSLRATLLVEQGIAGEDLDVELRPVAAPAAGSIALAMAPDRLRGRVWHVEGEMQHYRWTSLWPGAYAVQVKAKGSHTALASVPVDIAAWTQAVATDIDLRQRLRVIRLRVVGTDGKVVPDGSRSMVLLGEADAAPRRLELRSGMARIVTGRTFADVLVLAEGFLPKRLRASPGDNTVVLATLPSVAIRVRGGLASLPDDCALAVKLVRQRTTGRPDAVQHARPDLASALGISTTTVAVDETGTASVPIALDGCYRVSVYVSRGGHSVSLGRVEPGEVHVAARTTAQFFQVRVVPEVLRDALVALPAR